MSASPESARPERRALLWIVALATLALASAGMLAIREDLDKAHIALAFLIVVLAGSAAGGRALGLALAGVAFIIFDYFFLPPYGGLAIANPLDWLVLAAFLVASFVAAQLLNRAQEQTAEARQRAVEVERLGMLGAEALNAGRAEDALGAVAGVIRSTLGVECVEIYLERGAPPVMVPAARSGGEACGPPTTFDAASLAAWVAHEGVPAAEQGDRTATVGSSSSSATATDAGRRLSWPSSGDVRVFLVPLAVRARTVGVLRIAHSQAIVLDPDQRRFLDALTYYAALAAERVRLAAEAERAAALREADELKSALLAAVSHDFRTPLTTIKALAHAIAAEGARPGDGRAGSIEEEADRLTRVVTDLLDLSRLTGGAIHLRADVNTAEDLVGAAIERVRGVAGRHELRIVRGPDEPILVGRFDFVHALRGLANLLENALKYSPADSPIDLSVHRENGMLVFSVADRGRGIAESERERIFEPFYRPPDTPSDIGGTGLGLTIARGLATAQGGDVRHHPRAGGGTVFELLLPAADLTDA